MTASINRQISYIYVAPIQIAIRTSLSVFTSLNYI